MSQQHQLLSYDPQGTHEPLKLLQIFLSEQTTTHHPSTANHPDPAISLDEIFRLGDFLFGPTFESAVTILDASESLISRIVSAPSQRMAYLVTSSGKQPYTKYLCLLPRNNISSNGICYCSCRSFMEKNSRSKYLQPCKHLLALLLLPHVNVTCATLETLTDEEFGRLLVTCGSPTT